MELFHDTVGIRKRINRPHGRLPKNNLVQSMTESALNLSCELEKFDEVQGITLAGGLSRGYGDELSEIDMNIYIREEMLPRWLRGEGPIPHGDYQGNIFHMDVSFLNLNKVKAKNWGLLEKWDASYQKVALDKEGEVTKMLEEKDVFTADEKKALAMRSYLDCTYFGDIVVRQWTLRKDPLVAHQMVTKGIPALCNLLFLANDEYPPFEKWLVNYSHSLEWKPVNWSNHLEKITLIKDITLEELDHRRNLFMNLYHEVWSKVVGEEYNKTGLLELEALETLNYVIKKKPSLQEFSAKYGAQELGKEVLFKLAKTKTINGDQVIVFDKERFLEEKKHGFPSFLGWNKEMLNHIQLEQE
jgi:hypothetical protein